jgi:plasmid stabilization system protein ParE
MGGSKCKVVFKEVAHQQIFEIMKYISERGNPERALAFFEKLYAFGNELGIQPEKYQICRKPSLEIQGFRCAVFRKNYIFIYKFVENQITIYSIIHASRYNF